MGRIMACTRIAQEYGPFPVDPTLPEIFSDSLQLRLPSGRLVEFAFDDNAGILSYQPYDELDNPLGEPQVLLAGIVNELDADYPGDDGEDGGPTEQQPPFVLEYELGRELHRMCCHLVIKPDDVQHLEIEGLAYHDETITLDFCVIPRLSAYDTGPGN